MGSLKVRQDWVTNTFTQWPKANWQSADSPDDCSFFCISPGILELGDTGDLNVKPAHFTEDLEGYRGDGVELEFYSSQKVLVAPSWARLWALTLPALWFHLQGLLGYVTESRVGSRAEYSWGRKGQDPSLTWAEVCQLQDTACSPKDLTYMEAVVCLWWVPARSGQK